MSIIMDCPRCGSNNTQHTATNPFTGVNKFYCLNCNQDFLGKKITIAQANLLDKDSFTYGIPSEQLKICPSCGERACYWIGGGPLDIECGNDECRFYKQYTKENRHKYAIDERYEDTLKKECITPEAVEMDNVDPDADTKDIDPMDFSGMFQ